MPSPQQPPPAHVDAGERSKPVGRPGPRSSLTLDRIAQAAVAIADRDGLAAASMARVAGAFGFSPMALYRYVADRRALEGIMLEAAIGGPPDVSAISDWETELRRWTEEMTRAIGRHPWTLQLFDRLRAPGKHELAWMEAAAACLAGTPLSLAERLDVASLAMAHIRAMLTYTHDQGPDRGLTLQEWRHAVGAIVAADDGALPHLAAAVKRGELTDGQDTAASFGLDLIMGGVRHLIAYRS